MPKLKVRKLLLSNRAGIAAIVLILCLTLVTGGLVSADKYDEQIRKLEQKNTNTQKLVDEFATQASTYQEAVNRLQSQIDSLQATIDKAQHQSDIVRLQIKKAEAEIKHNRKLLGDSIRAMYLEGQISTLEILASSSNLSEFVMREQYRLAVQNKVKETYDRITDLKASLEIKQRRLERLIEDTRIVRNTRAQAQAKQNQLLSYSRGQQASFEQKIANNQAKISELIAAQRAANYSGLAGQVVAGDPSRGGYPTAWNNAPMDSMLDSWGMYNRECVSYTAWKVYQTFGYMPYWGGRGNANQWPSSAQTDGYDTGSTPKVHSVAIWPVGYYGHAMWVEAVYDDGTIYVSQYNYAWDGRYSEMRISGSGLTYIYFK
ncbi:CHAP domain-containing protein [Candidatus Saccharibacteria bacterium]|nr:CHAP domain-containing protein [Candidatus Saccharibacteria bacterium]